MTDGTDGCPPNILGWIAWYPEGLGPRERGAVESHAAECPDCRREISMLSGNGEDLEEVPEAEELYAQVLARIESDGADESDAENTELLHAREGLARRRTPIGGGQWQRVAPLQTAALAASLLVAVLVGGLSATWLMRAAEPAEFNLPVAAGGTHTADLHTASGLTTGTTTLPALTEGTYLEVVFRDEAKSKQINEELRKLDAQITSGPSELGVYRLRLPVGADVAAAKEQLRGDGSGVALLAEPSRP